MKKSLTSNLYRASVGGINEAHKREKKFGNRVNYMSRLIPKARKELVDNLIDKAGTDRDTKKVNDIKAFIRKFLMWMFVDETRFKLIRKAIPSNKDGDRTAKEILKEIEKGENLVTLKVSPSEKVELAEVTGTNDYDGDFIGGVSVYFLMNYMYGIHKHLVKDLGNGYDKSDLTETKVLGYINQYMEARWARQEQRNTEAENQSEKDDAVIVEDHAPEFVEADSNVADIIEALDSGDIKSTDLTDAEKITEAREHASGGMKGALTRRLKQLQEA